MKNQKGSLRKKHDLYLIPEKTLPSVPGAILGPFPKILTPMLATLISKPFSDPEWIFEWKWDGVRTICFLEGKTIRLFSRNAKDMTERYPELQEIRKFVDSKSAILDGEIVALDENGKPKFQLLQPRIGLQNKSQIERLSKQTPVSYFVFDLLYYNGFNTMPCALIHRKALLKKITESNSLIKYSEHVIEKGEKLFKEARELGLEGIVAKRQDSAYVQKRSKDWLKIKTLLRQEMVIVGYTKPRGSRELFGALILGLYDGPKLRYVGHVGGGFNSNSLKRVYKAMQPLKTKVCPLSEEPRTNEPVQWIKPALVCEVKFSEWTADGRLRQPIFLGLRDDKEASQCVFEKAIRRPRS